MKKNYFLTILSLLFCFAIQAQVNYPGNGNSGFGDVFGSTGSLDINDDGTTITFTLNRGAGTFNDAIVIYIDSKTGGFGNTSTFDDTGDDLRKAISGFDGTNRAQVDFPAGFTADYAIAINVNGIQFGGLWELEATGSHTFIQSVNVSPNNNTSSATYTFDADFSEIGTTALNNFKFVATYLNQGNAFRSDEAIGDGIAGGNPGNPSAITFTGDRSYPNTWTGTTDTDWATATNWTEGVPTSTHNVYIPMVTNQPTAAGAVTINKGILESGASLITNSTFAGTMTYRTNVNDMNWHLLSSPVEGEGYNTAWVDDNLIDNTTDSGTNVGIATYINTTDSDGDWTYVTDGASGTFNTAQGYSIKRDAIGSDIAFAGTIKVDGASPTITANDIGGANENRWTLIGNPFPSYINVSDLLGLAANATALEDSREAIYVWDNNKAGGAGYSAITTGFIHPGQGFFVNSNVASTSLAINQDMLEHQSGITFYKNNTTSINLTLSQDKKISSTEINYLADKTTGLDPRFDIGTFNGVASSFSIYTHLISDDKGVNFMKQALPIDFENQIIPIGIKADSGLEITFTAEALNLPSGIKVFLEDRETNTFTRLDEANSEYKVTLNNALDGIGRFYMHAKSSALSTSTTNLDNVSFYTTNKSTLRVTGLSQGRSNIKLFTILGKQVLNTNFNSNGVHDVALPQLSTGVYIVQLESEKGKLNKKIVLE
ncbi:T9SS type A sorting domain-containing protein [Polaribacter porphyrae]|uniref:Secretion system C-terminal sorting domain-containing protein n=1 Tax=Polaribacter porphyrae TaxID=1137780 RepID=A0A2S7WN36_9FLAO|nr:T9SS type A sorting domain-containing protein [Polaribacter porphyrae]PQJ78732.1 hypothetical protein BTO18_05830 [Polaribacter porphyrae]